jgi:hypothetical protein
MQVILYAFKMEIIFFSTNFTDLDEDTSIYKQTIRLWDNYVLQWNLHCFPFKLQKNKKQH